jgi:hypothetical protein
VGEIELCAQCGQARRLTRVHNTWAHRTGDHIYFTVKTEDGAVLSNRLVIRAP